MLFSRVGHSEQGFPVGILLTFLVGVTLCLPHGPGATRVSLQAAACCHQLHIWVCLGMEGFLMGPGELTCAEPCSGGWVFLAYINI